MSKASAARTSWARVLESSAPIRRGEGAVATPPPCHGAAAAAKQLLKHSEQVPSNAARGPARPTNRTARVSDWQTIDYFFDESLVEDPYPYFDALREACPVLPLPHLGVVAVTGYDEAADVYRDTDSFSS